MEKELDSKFWDKRKNQNGTDFWMLDPLIKKKLLKIAREFYEASPNFSDSPIIDILFTGPLATFNYNDSSDIEIHILVNFAKLKTPYKELKSSIEKMVFSWNLENNIKIRGHEVQIYLQDSNESYTSSGIYSLMNSVWKKFPNYDLSTSKNTDVVKKYESIISTIDLLESKLIFTSSLPSNSKELYKMANSLLKKIYLLKKNEFSSASNQSEGFLVFEKLKKNGYIAKLLDIISKSHEKVFPE